MADLTDDIRSPNLLFIKGACFVIAGLLASAIILIKYPDVMLAFLLLCAVWCFARAYYFVFYVIEHYIDGKYRYRGIVSFVQYVLTGRGDTRKAGGNPREDASA